MSDEEFSNESLKKSSETVGLLYEAIVSEDGEVLDGKHRLEVNPNWPQKKVKAETRMQKILVRMHAHYRRRVSREETQSMLLELAQELEKTGIPKEDVSTELAKKTPYSEQYIRELLPVEYKKPEKVEAAKVGALLTAQKAEEKGLDVAVPCSTGCGVYTKFPKYWQGETVCSGCYDKLLRGEISLEKPIEAKPSEAPKPPPRVERRVYEPGAYKEEMRKPVSRMEEWVHEELQRRGFKVRFQERVCIKEVIPDDIVDIDGKLVAIFVDGREVHAKRTLVDMENRELLAKKGFRVVEIQYDAYTEEQRQLIMSEILSAIQ